MRFVRKTRGDTQELMPLLLTAAQVRIEVAVNELMDDDDRNDDAN